MTNFKFPPPPPPPPKAPSNDAQQTYNSQRGGGFRGGRGDRGDRSRGRGGGGRGRGTYHQGNSRGGFGQGDRGGSRGGYQSFSRGARPSQNAGHGSYQQQYYQNSQSMPLTSDSGSTANTYGNSVSGTQPPQLDPAALAQAMAFMSTPAGMQSMAAFANHVAVTNARSSATQSPPPLHSLTESNQSPTSNSVRKRKRDDRVAQYQAQQREQPTHAQPRGQKPPRAKAAAPPPVPSFGFSLPSAPSAQPANTLKGGPKNDHKKRKMNLGFTQMEEDDPESDPDEDVDEETAFSSNAKIEGIVFEHDGERISLQTQAEIAAWIKDRRKRFPTKRRIEEKAQEAAAKRANELDFLRKVTGKTKRKGEDERGQSSKHNTSNEGPKLASKSSGNLENLRQRVQNNMRIKTSTSLQIRDTPAAPTGTKPTIDLGLGYDSDSNDNVSSTLSDSSVLSSSEESSDDYDSGSDSDDEPPEISASNVPPTRPAAPPPQQPKPSPALKGKQPNVCPQWERTGKCKYGRHCRYPHVAKEASKGMGLYERMVEQELEKADQLALDAIKYLGRHGFLG